MKEPRFLTTPEVVELHVDSLAQHGGSDGLRDPGGLESAVMQPRNDYFYANADLPQIAAAYAFHIAQAQAFIDGNKRTAIAAALAFLELHRIETYRGEDELYDAMIAIANHEMTKADLADLFRRLFT